MPLHHHKKHWLLHATMWVSALCVFIACGFVTWKYQSENKLLVQQMGLLLAENGNVKGELSICTKKKTDLEKSVEGVVEKQIEKAVACELVGTFCDSDACLFSSASFGQVSGVAKLTGYAINQKRPSAYEENKVVECPVFVVTSGPQSLVNDLLGLVNEGNTINAKNEKGQLLLTIDPGVLTSLEKQTLTKSKEAAPVDIHIVRTAGADRGLPDCGSVVEVLRVK